MRKTIALVLALATHALAAAIPEAVVTTKNSAFLPASREIPFKAANGSDLVFNLGEGLGVDFGLVDPAHNDTTPLSKNINISPVHDTVELCSVRASQNDAPGAGMPRRDDCQALHDFLKGHKVFVYFEKFDVDTNRWAEIFWVGTCAFRAKTSLHNVVFANGDAVRFLDRALSRPAWTVNGRIAASGEADCTVIDGGSGIGTMFWRLQQRGPIPQLASVVAADRQSLSPGLHARDAQLSTHGNTRGREPFVVESFDMIPRNTSAYVFNSTSHNVSEAGASSDTILAKRYDIKTTNAPEGPYCNALWMSTDWDQKNVPRKEHCQRLLRFVSTNNAVVIFEERDIDYWARFAAHETCGIMYKTKEAGIKLSARDMAGFLDRALDWSVALTKDGGLKAAMGTRCGPNPDAMVDGMFSLFWRDPTLPAASNAHTQIKERDMVEVESTKELPPPLNEPTALPDADPSVAWADYNFTDKDGSNVTVQLNTRGLTMFSDYDKIEARLERSDTPLDPSKRCTGEASYLGGAHPDSALVSDCVKLRNFLNTCRFYWRLNREGHGAITPLAKVDTCHLAYGDNEDSIFSTMDAEVLLTGAIDKLDNPKGRMRGWGRMWCNCPEQFDEKSLAHWKIYP
ncbi:hypothetical protein CCHL11_09420 [Colletotrichum chlorophyti]|uniref:Ecp2 effector protein-like domain-containing protein n=1 Tax=Colletotrichum chlorophyti TaxID=708187 RepID=A0A1Q8R9M2_9PEZI|nr:hypothetical protein CCHL11_09420 [Colletotrichum chlorophyti]